jgi:hypothetical protein
VIPKNGQVSLLMMFNAGAHRADFTVPPPPRGFRCHLAVDISSAAPHDLLTAREEPAADSSEPWCQEVRSSAIFPARKQAA